MKIMLLNPPSEKGYIRSGRWTRKTRANQNWYPIWCAYCVALLEREGHECLLLDASVEELDEEQTLKITDKFKPDYIVFYWSYNTAQSDLQFAERCSKYGTIIMAGTWSFCLPDLLLKSKSVDLMTFGEFEHTLLEIVQGKTYDKIKGLIWKDRENLVKNEQRELCSSAELDKIPFVSEVYSRFLNFYKYRQTSLKFPFIDTQGARGCPNRCIYCVQTRAMQGGSSYRARSVSNIIKELWWIKNNLPTIKQIFFQDETFPQNHAKELSQAILDEKLDICWGGLSRGELNYETLKLMDESGCRTLQVGFETPIQKYLDTIHKDVTVEKYEKFCKDLRKTRILNNGAFMIFPWMTKADVEYTVNWAKKMKIQRLSFITAIPYPNTPYDELVAGQKGLSWEESVELEKWAHKEYYLKNPWMWKEILRKPTKWMDVFVEARGLLASLR